MTTEEKELLLKDLSARLPYKVTCYINCPAFVLVNNCAELDVRSKTIISNGGNRFNIEYVKPYLFPLSSMTEEQEELLVLKMEEEYKGTNCLITYDKSNFIFDDLIGGFSIEICSNIIDFLNANYFDYRGLIKKGLAIDATGLNIY